jgi:hypothetical protein
MAELGQTTDPKALIPGDPPAVYENARVLAERANSALAAGDALKRIDTGAWRGPASDKFHEDHQTEVPRWLEASDSLDNAAQMLTAYANTLSWAQGQASEAIAQWQQGDAATQQAKTAHDRAVSDAQAQTRSNAERGDPTVVQAPPFADPGEVQRQAARDTLNRARQQLVGEGDRCAEALRGEATLAPQDSRKQADANFFGGIWDTISGAGEALWTAITDPAETVAAMAHNITHPVDTFKEMVAWDDWANGHGDRALGKITGGLLLLGAGKVAKGLLSKGERAEGGHLPNEAHPKAPVDRAKAVHDAISGKDGNIPGVEDSKGVRMVSQQDLDGLLDNVRSKLGEPDKVIDTPKGKIETWQISGDPPSTVTYRTFSKSGGPTIDINKVDGLDTVKRFHVNDGGH